MDLFNLQLLESLIQDPHLSRVAARFHMTQSALSKRVQTMEEQLGFRLFDRRGPRGLEPTPAAREIAKVSEQVLTSWNSGLARAKRHQDEPTHFGVVGPQIFMREIILPWWNQACERFPELTLEAHISPLSKVSFELVQAGMDVGILEHKEDLEDFICKPVFYENWGIVVHTDLNLGFSRTEMKEKEFDVDKLDESILKKLQWGTLAQTVNPVDEWLVKRQKMPPPIYRMYWNDFTALLNWVMETPNAATVLPSHACRRAVKEKRVQFISLGKDSRRVLYMAYRQNHPHKKLIQEFMKIGTG